MSSNDELLFTLINFIPSSEIKKYITNLSDTAVNELLDALDLGILSNDSPQKSNLTEKMKLVLNTAKEIYVFKHHDHPITPIGDGRYKTYIGCGKERVQKAYKYEKLIDVLYEYYRSESNTVVTLDMAFSWTYIYWKTVKGDTENTLYRKKRKWAALTTEHLLKMPLQDVSEEDICSSIRRKCAAYKQEHNKQYGLQGVREYIQIIRKVFWIAEKHGAVKNNPADLIRAEDFKGCTTSSVKSADEKMISPEDKQRLIERARQLTGNSRKINPSHAFAAEFAVYIGGRAGEFPALMWSDIKDGLIHIHGQQLDHSRNVTYTKNERGRSRNGRYFPVTPQIEDLLDRIRKYQSANNINTPYVFVNKTLDGPMDKQSYEAFFRDTLCKPLGIAVSHNHGLRVALNSQEFQEMGLSSAERAYLLGHTVETNERNYSGTGSYLLPGIMKKLNR